MSPTPFFSEPDASSRFTPSQQLFQTYWEQARDLFLAVDRDGRVIYTSPLKGHFSCSGELLVGREIWGHVHPDDAPLAHRLFEELAARPGDTRQFEHRFRAARGEWRLARSIAKNLLGDPAIRAIIVRVHDVTENKAAEESLRLSQARLEQRLAELTAELERSESKYRRLVDGLNAEYVFYLQTPDGLIQHVSSSVEQVLGYRPEELVWQNIRRLLTDSPLNSRVTADFEEASSRRRVTSGECELRHADGTSRILEYLDVPMLGQGGELVAVEGIARDITVRRRAEAELRGVNEELELRVRERTADLREMNLHLWREIKRRESAEEEIRRSEERFRNVVEDQTEFIVRWLPDGARTFVNNSYCRFFGQLREELIGQSFFPTVFEEDRELATEAIRGLTPDNPVASYEQRVRRPDGSLAWTQWNDRAIFDRQGRVAEYQSVGRDITSQKAAEEKLRSQQDALAHFARLSLMGGMVAAISHEIGQPLHAIATFAVASQKALQANRPDSAAKALEWAGKIEEQVQRTNDIIQRLRGFTRPAEVRQQPFDMNEVIRECLELAAPGLRRRGVQVRLQLAPSLPPVRGDRIQIGQVLVNLLTNASEALEAVPAAERCVQIRSASDAGQLTVAVCDNGIGMSDESLERAFKAYYTTKATGLGIGLAISRAIMEQHHGRLWAERNADRGMSFMFVLPLKEEPTADAV